MISTPCVALDSILLVRQYGAFVSIRKDGSCRKIIQGIIKILIHTQHQVWLTTNMTLEPCLGQYIEPDNGLVTPGNNDFFSL